jgi:iron complex outermembrane receptor protein
MAKKIVFAILVLWSIPSIGQTQDATTTDTIDIDEVVVTGTKTSVNRNQIPYTISVITANEIANSTESSLLPILSEQIPGLFISERGVTGFGVADGSAGQISLRGIGGSPTTQVLILLNGNPQYMGIMGHPLADAYRSSNIERVEVIRGPASTLYGSNAMGGVINIITKEQKTDGYSGHLSGQYGSFNTLKLGTGGGFKKQGFASYAGINFDHTDGHREASFFNIVDGYYKASYEFNKNFKLAGDISLANFNGADPGLDTSDVIVHRDTLDILRGMGSLVLNNSFDKTDGSVRAFYNFGHHDITSGFLSDDYNYGLVVYQNLKLLKGNTITLGLDYKNYGGKAELTKYMGGTTLVDTSMQEVAGLLTIQQQIVKQFTLNAGLRLEHHSAFGTELVPTGGLVYRSSFHTIVKATVSKGFRSPTIRELFIQFPFAAAPNPDLKPERSVNSELSIHQSIVNNALSFELTLFNLQAKNLINIGMSDNELTFLNSGKANNNGIEFGVNHTFNKRLKWNANYSYIWLETPIVGTPAQKTHLGVDYSFSRFTINTSYQYISDLYLVTGINSIKESYGLLNSRLNIDLGANQKLFIEGENLLNTGYTINYGYPMPGITIMAGFHIKI